MRYKFKFILLALIFYGFLMTDISFAIDSKDQFFGVDGAISWLARGNQQQRRNQLFELIKSNQITSVRERLMISELASQKGSYATDIDYASLRQRFKQEGIKVLDLWHDTPLWLKSDDKDNPYPDDLAESYQIFEKIANQYQDNWCGLEIWNEPDISFGGNLPFDQYLPLVKVANLASKGRNFPLIGVVSAREIPEDFHRQAAANNVFELIDVVSFHSYGAAQNIGDAIRQYYELMSNEPRPIWITESGYSFPITPNSPPNEKDLAESAWHIAAKAIEAKAYGVEKIYPFILSSYSEGPFSFSLLDADYAPYPSALAYFAVIRELSNKTYQGDLTLADFDGNIRVFADKQNNAIAVFIGKNSQSKIPVHSDLKDIYGNSTTNKELSGIAYMSVNLKDINPKLLKNSEVMNLNQQLKRAAKNKRKNASTLVIQPRPKREEFYKINSAGYFIEPANKNLTFPIKVYNFGNDSEIITLEAKVFADTKLVYEEKIANPIAVKSNDFAKFELSLPIPKLLNEYKNLELKLVASTQSNIIDKATLNFIRNEFETIIGKNNLDSTQIINFGEAKNWISTGSMWYGQKDLDATLAVTWQSNELNIQVDVVDNIHSQDKNPAQLWMNDSVQIAVQALDKSELGTTQFSLALSDDGKNLFYADRQLMDKKSIAPKNLVIKKEGNKIIYKLSIAPETLGLNKFEENLQLGLSVFVNDNDLFGRKGGLSFGDGIARFNGDSKVYNRLILK